MNHGMGSGARQTAMRKVRGRAEWAVRVAALIVLVTPGLWAADCYYDAPGCLDPSFGAGTGKVITDTSGTLYPNGLEWAYGVAVQSDGKIVVGGVSPDPADGTQDFAVVRHNADGVLDTNFGSGGVDKTSLSTSGDTGWALTIQQVPVGAGTEEKILLAGGSQKSFAIVRYNPDGTLDSTFGSNGKTIVSFGSKTTAAAYAVAVQADRKIVLAGTSGTNAGVVRLTQDGTLDSGFGSGGKVTSSFLKSGVRAVVIQADGRIVAGGSTGTGSADFALVRFQANGTVDNTFGSKGKVLTNFFSYDDEIYGLAIDSVGRIVAVGRAKNGLVNNGGDFALARYLSTGQLDTSFGTGGKTTTRFPGKYAIAHGVVIQPEDGKILVGGEANISDYAQVDFALARYNLDGTLDDFFGSGGTATTDFTEGASDVGLGIVLYPDGKAVVAGYRHPYSTGIFDISLARYFR